jgi:hypothetical protein
LQQPIKNHFLDSLTGDFLSALIVEYIHYRFVRNDKKPVWLKIDWIHERLPYISRSGLAKKLKKLVSEGHIIEEKGEGSRYHKCWYSPSADMCEACSGKSMSISGASSFAMPAGRNTPPKQQECRVNVELACR